MKLNYLQKVLIGVKEDEGFYLGPHYTDNALCFVLIGTSKHTVRVDSLTPVVEQIKRPVCADCTFFDARGFLNYRGYCRRRSPQLYSTTERKRDQWGAPFGEPEVTGSSGWPTVSASESCGEFDRNEGGAFGE